MSWDADQRWRDSYDAWKTRAPEDEPWYREPPCEHDYEVDRYGQAACGRCGETWWLDDDELQYERLTNKPLDRHLREIERREFWRKIRAPFLRWTLGPRLWLDILIWRRLRKRSHIILDEEDLPF